MRMVPATLAVLVLACQAPSAVADEAPQSQQCGPYKAIAAYLFEKYHEAPVAEAIGGQGDKVFIVFASPLGQTWTNVIADAKGEKGCIVASGEQWVTIHVTPHMTGPGI